jgi:hypothetical protein
MFFYHEVVRILCCFIRTYLFTRMHERQLNLIRKFDGETEVSHSSLSKYQNYQKCFVLIMLTWGPSIFFKNSVFWEKKTNEIKQNSNLKVKTAH